MSDDFEMIDKSENVLAKDHGKDHSRLLITMQRRNKVPAKQD